MNRIIGKKPEAPSDDESIEKAHAHLQQNNVVIILIRNISTAATHQRKLKEKKETKLLTLSTQLMLSLSKYMRKTIKS